MTTSSKTISRLFDDLGGHGFRKKGLLWCRLTTETVFSFELQKSKHADRYYINVGVFFLSLDDGKELLPPHRCHFYGRFGNPSTEDALDFESEPSRDRAEILQVFKIYELLPTADACRTTSGAIAFFRSDMLRVPFVIPEARNLLGLES